MARRSNTRPTIVAEHGPDVFARCGIEHLVYLNRRKAKQLRNSVVDKQHKHG